MASKLQTLDRIREVEKEVRALKARAEEEHEKILREAKREALNLEEELRTRAEDGFREILAAARERIHGKREEILAAGRREADRVKVAAREHIEAGVQQLLQRFEETIHAEG